MTDDTVVEWQGRRADCREILPQQSLNPYTRSDRSDNQSLNLFRSLGSRYTRTVESITMNKAKIALTPANGAQRRA